MARRVLFVCLGNICRSPTAEAVMRAKVAERGRNILVDSAGTGSWHTGDAPDLRMQDAAAKAGYDLAPLRARQVTADDFDQFDLIIAMDGANQSELERRRPPGADVPVRLLLPYGPTDRTEVPDPYYEGGFDLVVGLIETAVEGLLDDLA